MSECVCPICWEPCVGDTKDVICVGVPCGHLYHQRCLESLNLDGEQDKNDPSIIHPTSFKCFFCNEHIDHTVRLFMSFSTALDPITMSKKVEELTRDCRAAEVALHREIERRKFEEKWQSEEELRFKRDLAQVAKFHEQEKRKLRAELDHIKLAYIREETDDTFLQCHMVVQQPSSPRHADNESWEEEPDCPPETVSEFMKGVQLETKKAKQLKHRFGRIKKTCESKLQKRLDSTAFKGQKQEPSSQEFTKSNSWGNDDSVTTTSHGSRLSDGEDNEIGVKLSKARKLFAEEKQVDQQRLEQLENRFKNIRETCEGTFQRQNKARRDAKLRSLEERFTAYKEAFRKEEQRHENDVKRLEALYKRIKTVRERHEGERRKDARIQLRQACKRVMEKKAIIVNATKAEEEEPEVCTICYEPLQCLKQQSKSTIVAATSCGHCFHPQCCRNWINSHYNKDGENAEGVRCPICSVPSFTWVRVCLGPRSERLENLQWKPNGLKCQKVSF